MLKRKKILVTATHKNQVRAQTSEKDKKWLLVDTRREADSLEKNGFFSSDIIEWDNEGPPSNSTKDDKKTPYERNRQEAFNSVKKK